MTRALVPLGLLLLAIIVSLSMLVNGPESATPGAVTPASAAPGEPPTLTIFAAASLTDAFTEIGATFEAETGVAVTFNFGASSQLRTQLEQGAVADVYASADQAQMDRARQGGAISSPGVIFAGNRLVIITPKDNPAGIQSAADLAQTGVRLVTAAPEVPIGAYTQQMFDWMSQREAFGADFKERANANVVSREPNVRQVVAKVLLGEADAAVVYQSDVTRQSAPDLVTIPIPDDLNTLAAYPIALVAGGPQIEPGQAFIDFVLSPAGQDILQKWNFTPALTVPAG